ncbi:MAG: hypothetical protein UFA98_09775, partial [Ruminococcus sp.]|nr:hypothetical protein [Ruminococcus sp.]
MIQKIKKHVSILLTVLMVFSVFAVVPFAASAAELAGYVMVQNLSVGDIIGGDVQRLYNFNYTLTLEANRYGDYFGKKTEATVTSSFDFTEAHGSDPVCIFDMMNGYNRYYPYDENGNRCEAFIVTAVDHSARTFSLAGYLVPDNPVLLNSSVKYRYCDGTAFHTGNTPAASTYKVDTGNRKWTNNSWYVVTENVTFEKRIEITGTVNLVLCDGATLTAKQGISVNNGHYNPSGACALNIYAQNGGTGALYAGTANGTSTTMNESPQRAAIGGDDNNTNGDITIHGGNIYAISNIGTAGIGGGQSSEGGNVTIYGGNVTAGNQNSYGSGIGGGYHANAGNINILGGTVTAFATGQAYDAAFGTTTTDRTVNLTIPEGATMVAGNNADSAVATTVDEYKANRKVYARVEAGELPNYYTVDWKNDNGSVLKTKEFAASAIPVYDGETPTKPEDETNTYTFAGWKNGETTYAPDAALPAVTDDVTYTATFTAVPFVASVTSNGTTTKYANFSDALNAWTDGSTLTLLADVTMNGTITVSGTRTLDLNGYGITKSDQGRLFNVDGNLTINDSNPTRSTHKYTVDETGLAVLDENGTQSFQGGYITGGHGYTTSGEYGWGGFAIVDLGHKNQNYSLTINGGTIIGNKTDLGGGGVVRVNSNGIFTMNGGAIIYNTTATDPASENNDGAVSGEPNVKFYIRGGTIAHNTTKGGVTSDLYLANNQKVIVDGELDSATSIGIKMQNGTGVFTNSSTTDYNVASKFKSDDSAYGVLKNTDGQLELKNVYTVTWKNWNDEVLETDENVFKDTTPTFDGDTPTKPEDETNTYTFSGWKNGETTYAPDAALPAVTGDVTYTAVFTATPYVASVTSNGTTTKYADFGTAVSNWTDGSTLTLLADVTTSSTIGVSGPKTLDLNGKTITMTGNDCILYVNGGSLTVNGNGGTLTGGKGGLNYGDSYRRGGAIDLKSGSVVLDNCNITNNTSSFGSAVFMAGSTVLTIQNGTAITNNVGGNAVLWVQGGTVNMTGGTISNNSATAVSMYSNNWYSDLARFNMSGGTISNNTGSGVAFGGNQTGQCSVSGNAVIKDNTSANLNLSGSVLLNVNGELGDDASIGITKNPGVFTNSTDTSFNDASKFFSDKSDYIVGKNAAGQLLLGVPRTVTWKDDEGNTIDTTTVANGGVPTHDAPEKAGCNFAGWKNGDTTYPADSTLPEVTGDVTYTATFEPKKLIAGHTLTLDGNIGINFYIDPSAAGLEPGQSGTLKVDFAWANSDPLVDVVSQSKTVEVNSSNYTQVGDLIKVTCKVCAAEMSCDVKATVALNNTTETE